MSEVLSPRAEQMGPKKYKEMIRKKSKEADEKNLPFNVVKKSKAKNNNIPMLCVCKENTHWVNKNTFMVTCSKCQTAVKVSDMSLLEDTPNTEISIPSFQGQEHKLGPFTKKKVKTKGDRWV
jgi:hypothetical protein